MEYLICHNLISTTVIATKFCTWRDSCAVVACAKFCNILMVKNWIRAKQIYHRIWITSKWKNLQWNGSQGCFAIWQIVFIMVSQSKGSLSTGPDKVYPTKYVQQFVLFCFNFQALCGDVIYSTIFFRVTLLATRHFASAREVIFEDTNEFQTITFSSVYKDFGARSRYDRHE